jgi:hypothetical protein
VSTPQDSALSAQTIRPSNLESETGGSRAASAPDPDNPPWSLLQALLTWVASVAFLWLVPQLCVLPYVASHYRGINATRELLFADKTFVIIIVAGFVPAHLLTLALSWAVVTRLGRVSAAKVLGWRWKPDFGIRKSVLLAILLFLVAMAIIYKFGGQETDLERILQSSRATALITAFLATATAPLVEEVIYRGLLYSAFQRVIGPVFAVIVVASMFAGLHVLQYWPNAGAISAITLLSVVLTIVRARTGRLLPCFVIHLVFNGIQSLIIVFDPYLRALIDLWQHHAANPGFINFLLGLSR